MLTFAFDLWERAFHEVGEADYPDIKRDYAHVDATCMWMVKNPEWFDVIVTDNMFGDIITDLGAMIQGGMGIAAGGNINPEGVSMFEPIGGSAPEVHRPERHQPDGGDRGGPDDARAPRRAEGRRGRRAGDGRGDAAEAPVDGGGQMGYSTSQVGDLVADAVARSAR